MPSGSIRARRSLFRTITIAIGVTAVTLLLQVGAASAQDPLNSARDLYAAAAYEDALTRLNELRAAPHPPDDDRTIDQYRALFLFRWTSAEAQRAIESMVAAAPAYRPSDSDASPRVQAAFRDVRQRVLPGIIQQKYDEAKTAFDRKDLPSAKAGFTQVIALLADPAMASGSMQLRAELLTLAAGSRDLSTPAVAPPPPIPQPAAPPPPPIVAVKPQPPAGRIYTAADPASRYRL